MRKKEFLLVIIMIFSGLILYTGVCKLMELSLINRKQAIYFRNPISTGHEGELMPDIKLFLPDSSSYIYLRSVPRDKPFVLFYFGPYCPYCQNQMKEIIRNIDKLKNINFYLITPYSYSDMMKFYGDFKIKEYKNIITGVDSESAFAQYFRPQKIPYLAIYNRKGRLNFAFMGNLSFEQIITASKN